MGPARHVRVRRAVAACAVALVISLAALPSTLGCRSAVLDGTGGSGSAEATRTSDEGAADERARASSGDVNEADATTTTRGRGDTDRGSTPPKGWPRDIGPTPGSQVLYWGAVGDQSWGANLTLSMTSPQGPVVVISDYHAGLGEAGWYVEASPNVAGGGPEAKEPGVAWMNARKGRLRVAIVAALDAAGRTTTAIHVTEEPRTADP